MSNLFTHFVLHESVTVARDFYRPQCSCGKVIFSQASVILSTGGVYPSMHWGRHPLGRYPPENTPRSDTPWADTPPPWADTPPPGQTPCRRPLQRAVRVLHECFLVLTNFIQCVQTNRVSVKEKSSAALSM